MIVAPFSIPLASFVLQRLVVLSILASWFAIARYPLVQPLHVARWIFKTLVVGQTLVVGL